MRAWDREEMTEDRVAETRLGWVFVVVLALFLVALLGVGSILRFIW